MPAVPAGAMRRRMPGAAVLAASAAVLALRAVQSASFVALPSPAGAPRGAPRLGSAAAAPAAAAHGAAPPHPAGARWPLLGAACCLLAAAAATRSAGGAAGGAALAVQPVAFAGGALAALSACEEPARVVMYAGGGAQVGFGTNTGVRKAGGRRKRLGVSGRVCMLTGMKKFKGFYRTYTESKNVRYYRPNTHWKRLWWDEEKMWVRLFVSTRAMRMVDDEGLQAVATRAGLDLYAWIRPHWMPGSRQPLPLKVGYTDKAKAALKYWPDYEDKLNKGAPLAEICPAPTFTDKCLMRTSAHAPNNGKPAPLDMNQLAEKPWKKAKRLSQENRLRLEAFQQS